MATELLLAAGSSTWESVGETIRVALTDLVDGLIGMVEISAPGGGHNLTAVVGAGGRLELRSTGVERFDETLDPPGAAAAVVRTVRDVYGSRPDEIEVLVTL